MINFREYKNEWFYLLNIVQQATSEWIDHSRVDIAFQIYQLILYFCAGVKLTNAGPFLSYCKFYFSVKIIIIMRVMRKLGDNPFTNK